MQTHIQLFKNNSVHDNDNNEDNEHNNKTTTIATIDAFTVAIVKLRTSQTAYFGCGFLISS